MEQTEPDFCCVWRFERGDFDERLTSVGCFITFSLFLKSSSISAFIQLGKYCCGLVLLKALKRSGLLSFPVLLQQSFNIRWALILEHGNTPVISPKAIPSPFALYFSIASSSIFLSGNRFRGN